MAYGILQNLLLVQAVQPSCDMPPALSASRLGSDLREII